MSSSYPTSLDSFSTKVDGVTDVVASHVNDLQDAIVATQTNLGISATTTFTPTLSQSGSIPVTVNRAVYKIINKIALVEIDITATSTGTSGQRVVIAGIPTVARPAYVGGLLFPLGTGFYYDVGVGLYSCIVRAHTDASNMILQYAANTGIIGVAPAIAVASSDRILLNLWYEVA